MGTSRSHNLFGVLVLFASGLILNACATVTTGSSQSVVINTAPSGAECTLTREGNIIAIVNPTPGTIMIDKDKDAITALCKKDGYQDGAGILSPEFQGMTLGNILIGGIIGLGVDAVSGAMHKYPPMFTISLVPSEFNSTSEKDNYFDNMITIYLEQHARNIERLSSQCDMIDKEKESEINQCQNQLKTAEEAKDARLAEIEEKRLFAKVKN